MGRGVGAALNETGAVISSRQPGVLKAVRRLAYGVGAASTAGPAKRVRG